MNHDYIKGKQCTVTDYFIVKVNKVFKTKRGTIVGYYLNPTWNPRVYQAFHIEFDDGTKETYSATKVIIERNV